MTSPRTDPGVTPTRPGVPAPVGPAGAPGNGSPVIRLHSPGEHAYKGRLGKDRSPGESRHSIASAKWALPPF
jgi:hypothetical protein